MIVFKLWKKIFKKHNWAVSRIVSSHIILFIFLLLVGSIIDRPSANKTTSDTDDMMEIEDEFHINDSLEDTLKESNVTEL